MSATSSPAPAPRPRFTLWESVKYGFYRFLAWWIRSWPIAFTYWFGLRCCDAAFFLNKKARRAVMQNLAAIYRAKGVEPSERLIGDLTRKTFQNFGKYLADFICMGRPTRALYHRYISIQGADYFRAIAKEPKGVILVTAHLGNWELGGALVAALGKPLNVIVRPIPYPTLERIYDDFRQRRGMKPILLQNAARGLLAALRRNEAVAFVADRDFTHDGIETTFFGRPTPLPRGPAWFAWKTKLPVYLGFVQRVPGDSYMLRFLPPLRPADFPSEQALRQTMATAMEKAIWRDPTQWYTFSPFWPIPESPSSHFYATDR